MDERMTEQPAPGSRASWLVTVPAGDVNFKATLEQATAEEVCQALAYVAGKPFHKARIAALQRRLRRKLEAGS